MSSTLPHIDDYPEIRADLEWVREWYEGRYSTLMSHRAVGTVIAVLDEYAAEIHRLQPIEKQRDALLEAAKAVVLDYCPDEPPCAIGECNWPAEGSVIDRLRAAIAAATGETA